ncbi:hypothetical protein HU200_052522 [Digitaria exilis]|uniref:GDSL esterase/lipase n=1 Tax=Digitaria exilis TaxID=1010633 RepID=A0A835E5U5_9POAL|nr:hypothetical protein HU200_052522 [Digitaria exilis]
MYVFGSSILDVGNNNYLPGAAVGRANRRYNGIDFPASIPTGRFSNGYNIADYVAKEMGFACSPPAYLSLAPNSSSGPLVPTALATGVSYASGGAGILDSTNAGNTIPLSKQVHYFGATKAKMVAAVGPRAVDAHLSKSIFLLGIGNNDMYVFAAAELARNTSAADQRRNAAVLYVSLISNYSATISVQPSPRSGQIIHSFLFLLFSTTLILINCFGIAFDEQELYTMGARKFAIINVGLVGCVPGARVLSPVGACWGRLNELAGGFNDVLRSRLAGLTRRLPGLAYSIGDSYGFTRDTLADPQASGFADVAAACCGSGRLGGEAECFPNSTLCSDRDRHVFWDRAHLSQRTAFLVALAFYSGPGKYTVPINFMELAQSS